MMERDHEFTYTEGTYSTLTQFARAHGHTLEEMRTGLRNAGNDPDVWCRQKGLENR